MKPQLILFCFLLSACADSPGTAEMSPRPTTASLNQSSTRPVATPSAASQQTRPVSAPSAQAPVASSPSLALTGDANLNGKIIFADLASPSGLRIQQVASTQFGVRIFIQNCDDLLAEVQTAGEFKIANLPENVPLDVDIYDLSNPLLQLRAQVTLQDSETTLVIQSSSTALALLQRFLQQNQSPTQGIPTANFDKDRQLNQELSDLTALLRPLLGQETLRSLQYQPEWNSALKNLQNRLENLIKERPELLLLTPEPASSAPVTAGPSANPVSNTSSGGGGSSPTSNQEGVGGTIDIEGL